MDTIINNVFGVSATVKIGFLLFFIGVLGVLVLVAAACFSIGKKFGKNEYEKTFKDEIQQARADAVKRSRAVLSGQLAEQVAPFLPAFPCRAEDCRFVGKPIDFVAFTGLSEDKVEEILFIEVKSGSSALSSREKEVKDAIEQKRVRYVEYRV